MKIDTIERFEAWRVKIPLKKTIVSSRGSLDVGEKVVIKLTTKKGFEGVGESSVIFPSRSGENAATIFVALKELFAAHVLGKNPIALQRILESLTPLSSEQFAFLATVCSIDLALHDLKAKIVGLSVADLLGGAFRHKIPLSRSISVGSDEEIIKAAKEFTHSGYRLLTLKGTKDWRANIKTFEKVREAIDETIELEIDPNQAWTAKGTLEVDRALSKYNLACIEQPCLWWDLEAMQYVTQNAHTPIAADESLLSPADAMRIVRMRAADILNLKLAKSGGIDATLRIVHIAQSAGLECNVGSKHPLGVGAAALLHFAASVPGCGEFIGYGSALERFEADIIKEKIIIENGCALLPEGIGFGVTLDEDALKYYAVDYFSMFKNEGK